MNHKRCIGEIMGGKQVFIGRNAPNEHVILAGISGSGKSSRSKEMEEQIVKNGGTVIAIDINGTHPMVEDGICNFISAQEDGLNVTFLDTSLVESGKETMINLVQYVMETICPRQLRGALQLARVREAIQFAIQNKNRFSCEMEAIACGLKEQDEPAALGAYNHLCPILEGNIFRKSEKRIQKGKINIISLKGLNPKTQKQVVEILLSVLWRKMRTGAGVQGGFTLVLDEFQNLDLKQGSALFEMLTEARKYEVRLVLATQTLAIFHGRELAVINQAATRLFFQQTATDIKRIGEMIEPGHGDKWVSKIARLRIGEAIAVGSIEINGRVLDRPIITHSKYEEVNGYLKKI